MLLIKQSCNRIDQKQHDNNASILEPYPCYENTFYLSFQAFFITALYPSDSLTYYLGIVTKFNHNLACLNTLNHAQEVYFIFYRESLSKYKKWKW